MTDPSTQSRIGEQPSHPNDLPDDAHLLADQAVAVLAKAKKRKLTVVTAESCTGGLLASLLTDQSGYGGCFERGFVTYTDEAKSELLGIDLMEIKRHGAVSEEVASLMAGGAIARSSAGIALAITGFAGPGERGDEAGLVYVACAERHGRISVRECHFGDVGRERTRSLAVARALEMLDEALDPGRGDGENRR